MSTYELGHALLGHKAHAGSSWAGVCAFEVVSEGRGCTYGSPPTPFPMHMAVK